MADNWIERRFRREENLTHSEDLWQSVSTAIDNACKSFNAHYTETGTANFQPLNGHAILVEISHEVNKAIRSDTKRRVRITFGGKSISITVDEHPAKVFDLDSDGDHCFIKSAKGEINPDEFSAIALSDALFTPRQPNALHSPAPKYKSPWN